MKLGVNSCFATSITVVHPEWIRGRKNNWITVPVRSAFMTHTFAQRPSTCPTRGVSPTPTMWPTASRGSITASTPCCKTGVQNRGQCALYAPVGKLTPVSAMAFNILAPAIANWSVVQTAGLASGGNPIGIYATAGFNGMFDYQRHDGSFDGRYTNASNYGVGVFMEGAGFSRRVTVNIASTFAKIYSSNAGSPAQIQFWQQGWNDARYRNLAMPILSPCLN